MIKFEISNTEPSKPIRSARKKNSLDVLGIRLRNKRCATVQHAIHSVHGFL